MRAISIGPTLGELLRRYKARQRITTPDLAEQLGASRAMTERLVRDRADYLDIHLAERISTALELDVRDVAAAHRASLELKEQE